MDRALRVCGLSHFGCSRVQIGFRELSSAPNITHSFERSSTNGVAWAEAEAEAEDMEHSREYPIMLWSSTNGTSNLVQVHILTSVDACFVEGSEKRTNMSHGIRV